jgi:hypothetical protein
MRHVDRLLIFLNGSTSLNQSKVFENVRNFQVFAVTLFMSEFRTIVSVMPSKSKIGLKTPVITAGSCFSDVIGQKLHRFKVPVMINPFGVIYNPVSIHNTMLYGLRSKFPPDNAYVESQGVHFNYDFHSDFSALNKNDLSQQIEQVVLNTHQFLKTARRVVLTYGTAWTYVAKTTGAVVANCHKVPSNEFTKSLLSVQEIQDSFNQFHNALRDLNPDARVILTVSPVRHIKDTLELNAVSKSILRVACHEISENHDNVDYFPSFEIMMDDLRDYRFYGSDMIHPSADAEQYIWKKFIESYIDKEATSFMNEFEKVLKALDHRPFHPESAAHQRFLIDTLSKLEKLSEMVNLEEEKAAVKEMII